MPSLWRLVNILVVLGATFLITFSTQFGGCQVQASPRPLPNPMPYPRFNARHQKKYIWTPDIRAYPCPSGKTRGHDGECHRIFLSHSTRTRRSPVTIAALGIPCPTGLFRAEDGDCHPIFSSELESRSGRSEILAKLIA